MIFRQDNNVDSTSSMKETAEGEDKQGNDDKTFQIRVLINRIIIELCFYLIFFNWTNCGTHRFIRRGERCSEY